MNINNESIPKTWCIVKLEEVCEILDSKRKPINASERSSRISGKEPANLYPYYGATGQVGYIDDFLIDGEYVLLGEDGAPFLDAFKNKAYLINGRSWVNNHAHILNAHVLNKYILFYLNQFDYNDYVTGTTRLKLNQASMREIPIKFAPLEEQIKIVEKIEQLFSEIDKGIENIKILQKQLEIYRQAILKSAFEGKFTEKWRLGNENLEKLESLIKEIDLEIETTNNVKQKKNKLLKKLTTDETNGMGVIDASWCYVRLSDISEDITDGDHQPPPKSENGILFITISNLDSNNKINFNKTFYVDESYYNKLKDNRKPQEGDILYTVTGSYGIPVLIDYNKEFCFQRHIALIRPYKAIKQKLLYYFLQSVYAKKQADEAATGTAQKTVSLKGLRNYILPLMPKEEQEIIVEEIEKRMSQCENIEKIINESLVKAEALKQSILKKAFEGKLVPQNPNDEPAEKLVERIKPSKSSK